jgi:hypothetical protein
MEPHVDGVHTCSLNGSWQKCPQEWQDGEPWHQGCWGSLSPSQGTPKGLLTFSICPSTVTMEPRRFHLSFIWALQFGQWGSPLLKTWAPGCVVGKLSLVGGLPIIGWGSTLEGEWGTLTLSSSSLSLPRQAVNIFALHPYPQHTHTRTWFLLQSNGSAAQGLNLWSQSNLPLYDVIVCLRHLWQWPEAHWHNEGSWSEARKV